MQYNIKGKVTPICHIAVLCCLSFVSQYIVKLCFAAALHVRVYRMDCSTASQKLVTKPSYLLQGFHSVQGCVQCSVRHMYEGVSLRYMDIIVSRTCAETLCTGGCTRHACNFVAIARATVRVSFLCYVVCNTCVCCI